jgi:hypothetical protein
METGIDFSALGTCFADMCKEMLDENCSKCDNVLDCILYPKCCIAAGVQWDPEDKLGWNLTVFLVESDGEVSEQSSEDRLQEGETMGYDLFDLSPEDIHALWISLQNCRFTVPIYKENIERILSIIWEGVSGNYEEEAPRIHEVPDFLEVAQWQEEEDEDNL